MGLLFTERQNFGCDQLKAFADNKLNFAKMTIFLYDRSRKHCGKCWLPAFSPFPAVFSKALFFMVIKSWDCVVNS